MRKLPGTILCLAAALPLLVASCSHSDPRTQALIDLRDEVEPRLEELQPGDWIVIGPEAAMEAAATCRVRHLNVEATNVSALRHTLDLMESGGELSPRLWVCREPESTSSRRIPGAARQRTHLQELLSGRTHFMVDARTILLQLKSLQGNRQVLFIHTDSTRPHSSIGIELDYAGRNTPPAAAPAARPEYRHADLIP